MVIRSSALRISDRVVCCAATTSANVSAVTVGNAIFPRPHVPIVQTPSTRKSVMLLVSKGRIRGSVEVEKIVPLCRPEMVGTM